VVFEICILQDFTQRADGAVMATRSGTVLVTGGAGFLGSHRADEQPAGGYPVRVLDNLLAQALLGYEPQHPLEEGLPELAEWLRGQVAIDRVEQATQELESRGLTL
jgi:nucleoside-diphosphate-sugar epimerase